MAALAAAKGGRLATKQAGAKQNKLRDAPADNTSGSKGAGPTAAGQKRGRSGLAAISAGDNAARPSVSAAAAFANKGRSSKRSRVAELAGTQSQESEEAAGADNTDMQETTLIRMMNTMMVRSCTALLCLFSATFSAAAVRMGWRS